MKTRRALILILTCILIFASSSYAQALDAVPGDELPVEGSFSLEEAAETENAVQIENAPEDEALAAHEYPEILQGSSLPVKCSITLPGKENTVFKTAVRGGKAFISEDLIKALGIYYGDNTKDSFPNVFLSTKDGHNMQFFIDNIYAAKSGEGYNLEVAPFIENGSVYLPLEDIAVYFACNLQSSVFEDTIYSSLTTSVYTCKNYNYVNSRDITSKTDYLIWVSKSDYRVNVYLGSSGAWRYVTSFPCAIGASSSPTVEGSFEYYQYQPKWTYDAFYCGPIMRFYNGYALHSTLIRYDGTPYDNRVESKISHGCVRIRPDGINWLASYIPLGTRILVTA